MAENPYIGKIKSNGVQVVKGNVKKDVGKNTVKNGGDLRTGSSKGQK